MSKWSEFLDVYYFNPTQPGAFAGPVKVKQILKENGYHVPLKDVKQWLQDQDAYSLQRQAKYRFKRKRVVTSGLDDMWDVDLADLSNIAEHNQPYRY